jgi:transposase
MATHYVARELTALGHDVKQVPATYAKPFRQGHKNDFRDAHAVAEAVQRPTTRFVPAKTDEQTLSDRGTWPPFERLAR